MIAALTGDTPKIAEYTAFLFTMSGDVEAESYAAAMLDATSDLALEIFCNS